MLVLIKKKGGGGHGEKNYLEEFPNANAKAEE